jgi:hypothetical protein
MLIPEVSIYKKATGKPTSYKLSAKNTFFYVNACAYDSAGNLFVDSTTDYSGQPNVLYLYELASGKKALATITVSKQILGIAGMAWDGKYLAIESVVPPKATVYRVAISGTKGTIAGSAPLINAANIGYFALFNGDLINPDQSEFASGLVEIYKYPTGGKPAASITGVNEPGGVAVSLGIGRRVK